MFYRGSLRSPRAKPGSTHAAPSWYISFLVCSKNEIRSRLNEPPKNTLPTPCFTMIYLSFLQCTKIKPTKIFILVTLLTALTLRVSSTPRRGVHISWSFLDILKLTKITLIKKNLPRWGRIHILRTAFVVRKQHEFFARLCRRQFQLVPVQPVIV